MNISITLSAIQFLGNENIFLGQPVKSFKPEYEPDDQPPFVFIPVVGDTLKVDYGHWVVTYPDGTVEVWNTESVDRFQNDLQPTLPVEPTIPPIV